MKPDLSVGIKEKEVCAYSNVKGPFIQTVLASQELIILSFLVTELLDRILANEINHGPYRLHTFYCKPSTQSCL